MAKPDPLPQTLIETIPDPDTVRGWLAKSIQQAARLRSLLRVAERKAQYLERTAVKSQGVSHA